MRVSIIVAKHGLHNFGWNFNDGRVNKGASRSIIGPRIRSKILGDRCLDAVYSVYLNDRRMPDNPAGS